MPWKTPKKNEQQVYPSGHPLFNRMREELGYKKIHSLKNSNAEELIKVMGTPLNVQKRSAQDYQCDPMTMVNVQSVVMSPATEEALFTPGEAPKFYRGAFLHFTDTFQSPQQEWVISKKYKRDVPESYCQGIRSLARAEKSYHTGDKPNVYHYLQMGIQQLEGHPEGVVGQFFFLVFQYTDEKKPEVLHQLLGEFKTIEKQLPPYLADQCRLFIARLERRLRLPCSIDTESLKHPILRNAFVMESQWNSTILKYLTTKFIFLNMAGHDIIYPWLKNRPS